MPIYDVYGERKYQQVMEETWGHLRAKRGEVFAGHMVFAHGIDEYTALIEFEFGELQGSPWLHEDTNDLIDAYLVKNEWPDGIFRFDGTYRVYKNGRRRFSGRTRRVKLERTQRARPGGGNAR